VAIQQLWRLDDRFLRHYLGFSTRPLHMLTKLFWCRICPRFFAFLLSVIVIFFAPYLSITWVGTRSPFVSPIANGLRLTHHLRRNHYSISLRVGSISPTTIPFRSVLALSHQPLFHFAQCWQYLTNHYSISLRVGNISPTTVPFRSVLAISHQPLFHFALC
jgi:hypothetical protein